jgi:hypothetical protein
MELLGMILDSLVLTLVSNKRMRPVACWMLQLTIFSHCRLLKIKKEKAGKFFLRFNDKVVSLVSKATNCEQVEDCGKAKVVTDSPTICGTVRQDLLRYWFADAELWTVDEHSGVCNIPGIDGNKFAEAFSKKMGKSPKKCKPNEHDVQLNMEVEKPGNNQEQGINIVLFQKRMELSFFLIAFLQPLGFDKQALNQGEFLLWLAAQPNVTGKSLQED